MIDYCPKCKKIQLLRGVRRFYTIGAFIYYYCCKCGNFIKSEQKTIIKKVVKGENWNVKAHTR